MFEMARVHIEAIHDLTLALGYGAPYMKEDVGDCYTAIFTEDADCYAVRCR